MANRSKQGKDKKAEKNVCLSLRLPKPLHKILFIEAKTRKCSMHSLVLELIKAGKNWNDFELMVRMPVKFESMWHGRIPNGLKLD